MKNKHENTFIIICALACLIVLIISIGHASLYTMVIGISSCILIFGAHWLAEYEPKNKLTDLNKHNLN